MQLRRLSRGFYGQATLDVARDLIGAILVDKLGASERRLRIVEVEAYIGGDDPASHAACGRTARNSLMYGPPGFAYVYMIYGIYHCLNFVTEREGYPAAVLIRAAEPVSGELEVSPRSGVAYRPNGPGKLTMSLGLNLRQNGLDLTGGGLYVCRRKDSEAGCAEGAKIESSPRIGISKGQDKKWRFFDSDSQFVSRR